MCRNLKQAAVIQAAFCLISPLPEWKQRVEANDAAMWQKRKVETPKGNNGLGRIPSSIQVFSALSLGGQNPGIPLPQPNTTEYA